MHFVLSLYFSFHLKDASLRCRKARYVIHLRLYYDNSRVTFCYKKVTKSTVFVVAAPSPFEIFLVTQ